MQDARKDVHLDVRLAGGDGPVGVEHRRRRGVVLVAPDDADRRGDAVELLDEVEHLGAVARNARVVAKPLRPEDGVGPAEAEAHRGGAAVVPRQLADFRERVGHVGFAGLDALEPGLRALRGARIGGRQRPGNRPGEQVRRRGDVAVRGELVAERLDVGIDPMHRRREHHRGRLAVAFRQREVAVERAAGACADLDGLAGHEGISCCGSDPEPS